jgi:hypothetical protein
VHPVGHGLLRPDQHDLFARLPQPRAQSRGVVAVRVTHDPEPLLAGVCLGALRGRQ